MGNHLARNIVREIPTNLLRAVKRKTRRFNVIPRAEKEIEKIQEKPTRAPIYEATQKEVERLLKEHPEKLDELIDKDESLNKNLESVYVKSTGENKEIFSKAKFPDSYQYRMMRTREPDQNVPEGRYNSTRAEHFLAAHERDPKAYSAEVLADVYKVDPEAMKNIVEYVKVYSVALPMAKTRGPGPIRQMAQDVIPGGMYEEPEIRVLERKVQLAKDRMAKLYSQSYEKRDKLLYDMNMFESLVAIKPMVKKVKEEIMEGATGAKNTAELRDKWSSGLIFKPESEDPLKSKDPRKSEDPLKSKDPRESKDSTESKDLRESKYPPESKVETADLPKNVRDDSFLGKTKQKLINVGVLESPEEIREQKEFNKLRAELADLYDSPFESKAELTDVSTPQMTAEHYLAIESQKKIDTILLEHEKKLLLKEGNRLLEAKKDEKITPTLESSSDSAKVENAQADDSKTQLRKKISDKG